MSSDIDMDDDDARMMIVTSENESPTSPPPPSSPTQSQSPEPYSTLQDGPESPDMNTKDEPESPDMESNIDDNDDANAKHMNVLNANVNNVNNEQRDDDILITMKNLMQRLETDETKDVAVSTSSHEIIAIDDDNSRTEEQVIDEHEQLSQEIVDIIKNNTIPNNDEYIIDNDNVQSQPSEGEYEQEQESQSQDDKQEPIVVDLDDEPDYHADDTNKSNNSKPEEEDGEEPEEGEDLEDGELEDDEDDDEPVVLKIEKAADRPKDSKGLSNERRDRLSRRASIDSKEKDKKRSHHSHHHDEVNGVKSKRSRLDTNNPMGPPLPDDDDDFLFVRGGSPSGSPTQNPFGVVEDGQPFHGQRPPDLFDIVIDVDERDEHAKHGRRGRSPQGNNRRRGREDVSRPTGRDARDRGNDRGHKSNRKEQPSLGDKLMNAAVKSDTICTYYMQGKCQKSHEECTYSHNAMPPRKMELCKFWMMECCAKKEKCLYLHNDFPCKFYHTGLICKAAERCKFSHKPLNEVTKAVLLKHIETAPKEILGDFPRLNRNGALTLINKMEARIIGNKLEKERKEKAKQMKEKDEKEQAEHPRRSRWEQPTHDDREKLKEMMEEAGIGGFYKETLEGVAEQQQAQEQRPPPNFNKNVPPPRPPLLHPPPPITATLPTNTASPNPFVQPPHIVHNPALANVLANLKIPSSTIDISSTQSQQQQSTESKENISNNGIAKSGAVLGVEDKKSNTNAEISSKEPTLTEPPEHLPPMQRELFLRIQQQQLKHDNKKQESDEEEDRIDDRGWYSSDEDDPTPKKEKESDKKNQDLDFSSVLSAIRQTAAAGATNSPSSNIKSSPRTNELARGDTDLRHLQQQSRDPASTMAGPFGDTDFRLPTQRPEFKDIDLRLSNSTTPSSSRPSTESSPPPVLFKNLPSGPAKEIDASLNSHPPMEWKVHLVAGVEKIDYSYIRHTMQPSQILMDPRLGPRPVGGSGGLLDLLGPSSPPPQQQQVQQQALTPPATIPGGDVITDPRVNRRNQQQSNSQTQQGTGLLPGQGLLGERPGFPRDPRSAGVGGMMNQPPPSWPTNIPPPDLTTQALAAQFLAAQQLGLPLFPFPGAPGGVNPFGQDFTGQQPSGHQQRHPSQFGGGGRGSSSWERYSQGGGNHRHTQPHHAGLSPPL